MSASDSRGARSASHKCAKLAESRCWIEGVPSSSIANAAAREGTAGYAVRNSASLAETVCSVEKVGRSARSASCESRAVRAIGQSAVLTGFCHWIDQIVEGRVTVGASPIRIDVVEQRSVAGYALSQR